MYNTPDDPHADLDDVTGGGAADPRLQHLHTRARDDAAPLPVRLTDVAVTDDDEGGVAREVVDREWAYTRGVRSGRNEKHQS